MAADGVGILDYLQNNKLFQDFKRITTSYMRYEYVKIHQ